jgi:hypothetical protein
LKQIDDPKTDKIVKSYLQEAYKDYGGKHKSLVIENGIIKSGVIDTSINAILEYILVTDRVCVMDLMRNLQIISLNFIQYNTISIGLDDLCQPYQKDLCDWIGDCISRGRDIDNKYYSNSIVAPINLNTEQYYELVKEQTS